MRLRVSGSPIERLRLMAKDVTGDAFRSRKVYREWIRFVVESRGHRQTNHNPGSCIEFERRQHDQRVSVFHFATGLRLEINPNHVAAVRAPGLPSSHYSTSL